MADYTPEQINEMLATERKKVEDKYAKTHISLNDFKQLEKENTGLKKTFKETSIKEAFLKNNGNEKHFGDFMSLNSNLYDIEEKDLGKSMLEIKKTRDWAFNATEIKGENQVQTNLSNQGEFIPGTFLKF